MKNILRVAAIFIFCFAVAANVQAQKFGYINSAALLAEMPKVKQADSNIEAYQKQLEKRYQQDVQALQQMYMDIQAKVNEGSLSPKQQEEEAAKLRTKEEEIRKFEADSQQQLLKKREELVQPILDEVNTAIQAVAKENGYQFIFDEQVLLYKDPAMDITKLVKTKLGLQ